MDTSSNKPEPEINQAAAESKDLPDKSVNGKRKPESIQENVDSSETSGNNVSPDSTISTSNLVSGREKRIRKIKAYDDDFLMYDIPSCSNSSLIQNLTKQIAPAQEKSDEIRYNLGDLVWAKVSGHPWWPCMISNSELSPTSTKNDGKNENVYFRLIGGSKPKRSYYVQFFGPSVEHAWVPEGNIISYQGLQEFKVYSQQQIDKAMSKSAKDKMSEKFSLSKIAPNKREEWEQAIAEADRLVVKKPRDRKSYFLKQFNENKNLNAKENSNPEPIKSNKLKRSSIEDENVQSERKKVC